MFLLDVVVEGDWVLTGADFHETVRVAHAVHSNLQIEQPCRGFRRQVPASAVKWSLVLWDGEWVFPRYRLAVFFTIQFEENETASVFPLSHVTHCLDVA